MAAKRLFICYARVDAANVQAVAAECTQLGQSVWFDQQLSGGQQWWDTILENIRGCDCVVFALSPASLQSKACRAELDYAHRLEKRILPVAVGEHVPDQLLPPFLAQTQRVDPSQPHQLARALLSLEPAVPFTGVLPTPPPVPISYLDELVGAVDKRELTLAEQRNLFGELKGRLASDDDRDGARALLLRLRQRSDVYNTVAADIDETLLSLPPPTKGGVGTLAPPVGPPQPKKRGRAVVGVIAGLLVVAGVGGAAYVIGTRDETTEPPPATDPPEPTAEPQPTDPPVSVTAPPVSVTAPVVDTEAPSPPTEPPVTEPPATIVPVDAGFATLKEKFPGVDFSLCTPLTSLPGRPLPLESARCFFPGSIIAEFYNFWPEDLESDVASWSQSTLNAEGWLDEAGVERGRVLDVLIATGGPGIYWTYDEDAFSVLAYGDPAVFVPQSAVEDFWNGFNGHAF